MLEPRRSEDSMAHPTQLWHEEHVYFQRLLQLLRHELDVLAQGDTPNYGLMLDIIGYLRDWSDQVHHPREDEVFRRLAQRRPDWSLRVARLRQEHVVIAHAGETLRKLLEEAVADAVVSRAEIEVAAATYLVYYGNHIAREEEDILPAAAQALSSEDWQAAKAAAPLGPDPLFGANPQERFRELRRRIAAAAA
jgi:hemerythrin-like domain-containing protein